MTAVAHRRSPKSRHRGYRGIARPVGVVVLGLAVAILLCSVVGFVLDLVHPARPGQEGGAFALLIAAAITGLLGLAIYLWGRHHRSAHMSRREATLAVAAIWAAAGICGALPFVIGAGMSPIDALFESVSGLTTTGATVITDIEGSMNRPLLLWRSLIQWLGGMGIVVLFVAVFPNVGVGGKHMFRGEVPGTTAEGLRPRIAETSFTLWKLYAAFTGILAVVLGLLGMDPFEAVCHAFTTMSTGGFSTRDASIAAFESPAIEYTIAIFMFIGTVNYGLYYGALRTGSFRAITSNAEFRAFVFICTLAVVVLTFGNMGNHGFDVVKSFRFAFFTVGTTISSTGFGVDDYMAYPEPVLAGLIIVMFIGGCAGSTAGGIKIERILLMTKQAGAQINRFFRPNVVRVVRLGRRPVPPEVVADVAAFFIVYMLTLGLGIMLFSLVETVPLPTAFGAMLTCLSNMGPAPFHLEADNFAAYGGFSKLFSIFAMLLGRLEFFTLLSLLVPEFWKH